MDWLDVWTNQRLHNALTALSKIDGMAPTACLYSIASTSHQKGVAHALRWHARTTRMASERVGVAEALLEVERALFQLCSPAEKEEIRAGWRSWREKRKTDNPMPLTVKVMAYAYEQEGA